MKDDNVKKFFIISVATLGGLQVGQSIFFYPPKKEGVFFQPPNEPALPWIPTPRLYFASAGTTSAYIIPVLSAEEMPINFDMPEQQSTPPSESASYHLLA